jgi:predicted metal-dependent phosphoesterase TrpH
MNSFRYDIHTHTKETSVCGKIPARELAARYIALGYDGIAVTDHLHDEYIESLERADDWNSCVDEYLAGYKAAKDFALSRTRGAFDVVLGIELRYPQSENDFLIFGVDEEFLRAHPYFYRSSPEDFFKNYGSKTLIIQAHPFRSGCNPAPAGFLHGIEVFNGNPRHDSRNDCALAFAKEHPHLLQICASDTHRDGDEGQSAILFDKRVRDSFALKEELARNKYSMKY